MIGVTFEGELGQGSIEALLYQQLIQELFKGQFDIGRVVLSELPGGHAGLSSLAILLAQPFGSQDKEYNPLIVRVGPQAVIDAEKERYERYILPSLGPYKALLRLHATVEGVSAIAYEFLFDRQSNQPLQTLRMLLQTSSHERDLAQICQALEILFQEMAPRQRKNGWYADGRLLQNQRPLWFYNTILPPTMMIELVEVGGAPDGLAPIVERLADFDRPGGADEDWRGRRVSLRTTDAYPHLRIAERPSSSAGGAMRLYLYEGSLAQLSSSQIPPIGARIDIVGSVGLLDALPDNLDGLTLQGRVLDTRYHWFDTIWRQRLGRLAKQTADGDILHQDTILKNPFQHYYDLLWRRRSLTTSIIHGDLNLGNILLSQSASQKELTAWLIDFDKTGPGGHTVFDAVKLETEYKNNVLPYRLRSLDAFILLERALYQALIDPDEGFHDIRDHTNLCDAYQFISTVRRAVLCDPACKIAPVEYYLGLLAYGLATLKHKNLYGREPWLQRDPYVQPRAVAAYLSASYAASKVEECEGVIAIGTSYPRIRRGSFQLIDRPWLIGRDEILNQALQSLTTREPVVVLYGQPGSGRGAIAQSLCAEMERSGYVVFQPRTSESDVAETLIDTLLAFLERHGVRGGLSRIKKSASKMQAGRQMRDLQHVAGQLATALDSKLDAKPICLELRLENADFELYTLIIQLALSVRQTALIIISDRYVDDLSSKTELEVLPLRREDVRAYVRAKQLPLEDHAIEHLHRLCYGFPELLHRTIDEARQLQRREGGTLQQAVLELSEAKHLPDFFDGVLARMPALVRQIFEIHALLRTYSSGSLDHVNQLIDYILPSRAAIVPELGLSAVEAYRQHPFSADNATGLSTRLHVHVLERLKRHDAIRFQSICEQIARFYQTVSPTDRYLIARYQALAGQWNAAAAVLETIARNPAELFNSRSSRLYALTKDVIDQSLGNDKRRLLEIAGDCAAYLGQYQDAAGHYESLIATLPEHDPFIPRIIARLLRVYDAYGDVEQARRVRELLFASTTAGDPLYALGLAHEGAELLRVSPERAVNLIERAIKTLEAVRSRWGDDELFYEEERVLLYDSLARAEAARIEGEVDAAIEHLRKVRPIADQTLKNRSLVAQIDNDLGYMYYYVRGQSNDPQLALRCFDSAYRERKRLGDLNGQLRAGQNLANLRVNLATNREDWRIAGAIFDECLAIVDDVESGDRDLIRANYMDALIHRGEFEQALQQFREVSLVDVRSDDTRLILLMNRAKLALWAGELDSCLTYLVEVSPLVQQVGLAIDRIEWSQIALECDIARELLPDERAIQLLQGISLSERKRLPDAAEWHFARGLAALAQGNDAAATEELSSARRLWSGLKYRYRLAIVEYWHTYILLRAGDLAMARANADRAEAILAPFGDTPVLQRMRDLFVQGR